MHKHDLPEDPIKHGARLRWSDCLREDAMPRRKPSRVIGVLTGEGIGPEVVGCALDVLSAVESVTGRKFTVEFGAPIGREAERGGGKVLPDEVIEFCRGIFARGGAVLSGPGGGRYVYDLRRVFDLFCKLSPLKVSDDLAGANRMKAEHVRGVDILMVRENASGLYQGKKKLASSRARWTASAAKDGARQISRKQVGVLSARAKWANASPRRSHRPTAPRVLQICSRRMRVRGRTRSQRPQNEGDDGLKHAPATRQEVSRMTPFLLLVDLQHDYLRAEGLEPAADRIVDHAAVLLEGCRAADIPVAHVWTTVSRADDQRMPHWKRLGKWMCVDGTPGHATPAPLRPANSELVIHKRFFCAFSSGTLAPMLTARGVDTLIVAGVHLHACVRQTILSAYEKGFDCWVADDAVGSDDPLHAAITRRYLQTRAARFASVAELLAMLSNAPAPAPTTPAACIRSTKTM
jgi:nicotinamidase-related amidase